MPGWGRFLPHFPEVGIGALCPQPGIIHGKPHGKVVEKLKRPSCEPQKFVQHIIEEASDAGPPEPCPLGLQVEYLADQSTLPEKSRVDKGLFCNP